MPRRVGVVGAVLVAVESFGAVVESFDFDADAEGAVRVVRVGADRDGEGAYLLAGELAAAPWFAVRAGVRAVRAGAVRTRPAEEAERGAGALWTGGWIVATLVRDEAVVDRLAGRTVGRRVTAVVDAVLCPGAEFVREGADLDRGVEAMVLVGV